MKKLLVSLVISVLLLTNLSLVFAENEDDVPRIFSVVVEKY